MLMSLKVNEEGRGGIFFLTTDQEVTFSATFLMQL